MPRVLLYGITFLAGAAVGGYVVKQIAISRAENAVGGVVDSALGKGTWYGGVIKTFANMFIESD